MSYDLWQLRKIMRLTQEDVSKVLGISLRSYRDKERKNMPFTQVEIIKLTIFLKLSREEVYRIFIDYNNNKKLFVNQNIIITKRK